MASALTETPIATPTGAPAAPGPAAGGRSLALDVYRGIIMVFLISRGFGLSALKDHPWGQYLARQVDHVPWEGLVLWDLIQPAFMFMVGVAMPFALAKREASFGRSAMHVIWRSAVLIFLSQLFVATESGRVQFGLINVLSQIAFTYLLCFLIMRLAFRWQVSAAIGLLAAHWLLFLRYPGPAGPFAQEGNIGQAIDQWLLGRNYSGYYVTVNFISSTVTTLFGVWAGMVMRKPVALREKLRILLWWACGCLIGGMLLSLVNPMVKRIWTASFTIYSGGLVLLGLALVVWLVDGCGWRRFAMPFVWVGTNSLFIYCFSQMAYGGLARGMSAFTGRFAWLGAEAGPIVFACANLAVMWWMCKWLYDRRAFVRI